MRRSPTPRGGSCSSASSSGPVGRRLAADLPVTRPAVSQHLKVLKQAGLVQEEPVGARRIYRAEPAALGELRAYVDQMWRAVLERLGEAAERDGEGGE